MREGRPVFRTLLGAVLLILAGAGVALSVWQLERRAWKHALIDAVETRAFASAQPAPPPEAWNTLSAERDAYRKVTIDGTFDHERETLVRAVTDIGSGYWVLTPLMSERFTVLVNRGFVPLDKKDWKARMTANGSGPVKITGLLRFSEPRGGFLRTNLPEQDLWYSRDVTAISKVRQLGNTAPYFIDADSKPNRGGYPIGGLTVLRFSDNHLVYALTWFALAAGCLGGLIVLLRAR